MSIKKLFDYSEPIVTAATLIVFGFVASAGIAGYTAYQIKVADDVIEVTGSAKEAVTADYAKWTIHLETRTGILEQQAGFDRLSKATDKILAYLQKKGFEEVETPVISAYPDYSYPQYSSPVLNGYVVSRDVIVRSENIDDVATLANNIAPLTGPSYTVSTNSLELTYRGLDATRVALLSKAVEDAQARAEAIAKQAGRSVGMLRSSSSGVVQVLPKGGVEVSDYGMYDTQSKDKEVMVTVRTKFKLR